MSALVQRVALWGLVIILWSGLYEEQARAVLGFPMFLPPEKLPKVIRREDLDRGPGPHWQFQQWWLNWAPANLGVYPDVLDMLDHLRSAEYSSRDLRFVAPMGFLDPDSSRAEEAFRIAIEIERPLPAEPVFEALRILLSLPTHERDAWMVKLVSRYEKWPAAFLTRLNRDLGPFEDHENTLRAISLLKAHPALPHEQLIALQGMQVSPQELQSYFKRISDITLELNAARSEVDSLQSELQKLPISISNERAQKRQALRAAIARMNMLETNKSSLNLKVELQQALIGGGDAQRDPCERMFEF